MLGDAVTLYPGNRRLRRRIPKFPQIHLDPTARDEWAGIPVFMCPSPQRDRDPLHPEIPSTPKGFLVVRLKDNRLDLAHHGPEEWLEHESRVISLAKP